jgi:hypothetical protein
MRITFCFAATALGDPIIRFIDIKNSSTVWKFQIKTLKTLDIYLSLSYKKQMKKHRVIHMFGYDSDYIASNEK